MNCTDKNQDSSAELRKMPSLDNTTYSRDTCVAAISNYYNLLTAMYLDPSLLAIPPAEGWPSINSHSLASLGKTDEVIELLRHLPYIKTPHDLRDEPETYLDTKFADWDSVAEGSYNEGELKVLSEGAGLCDNVPSHVVGLTFGGRNREVFLLDTKLGIVLWPECPGNIQYNTNSPWHQISDSAFDYAADNEAEWRADAAAWDVVTFFKMLEDELRELRVVPLSPRTLVCAGTSSPPGTEGMVQMVQGIFREHGWPDLKRYRKGDCLRGVKHALESQYPDETEWHSGDDEIAEAA
jgi:hypothetical protein